MYPDYILTAYTNGIFLAVDLSKSDLLSSLSQKS